MKNTICMSKHRVKTINIGFNRKYSRTRKSCVQTCITCTEIRNLLPSLLLQLVIFKVQIDHWQSLEHLARVTFSTQTLLILLFEVETAVIQWFVVVFSIDFCPDFVHVWSTFRPFFLFLFKAIENNGQSYRHILTEKINYIKPMVSINSFNTPEVYCCTMY